MTDYIRPLLRMFILFALVFAAVVLAKPTRASAASQDCCQTCDNRYTACLSACTTQFCRLSCSQQLGRCIEICPACE
jgi:hypothetical protein